MPSSSIEAANKEVKPIILESQISSEHDAASTRALTEAMKIVRIYNSELIVGFKNLSSSKLYLWEVSQGHIIESFIP